MSDRGHPEYTRSTQERAEQTQQLSQPHRPYVDPAYSGQPSFPPPYYPGSSNDPTSANPTDRLHHYRPPGQTTSAQPPHDPDHDKPKAPRWLWIAAVAAVLLVAALIIALVIANVTAGRQTAVPALPSTPSSQRPILPIPVLPRLPSHRAQPPEPTPTEPGQPSDPSAMQTVVYNVSGDGRAISITYVDNDGMVQTEFNVALPWIKEVSLPASGSRPPNVTIVNIGHEVTCTVTVDGVDVTTRTSAGLTICNGNN